MASTTGQSANMSRDELRKLKEGEIFVDEDGKRYRVKKSMLAKGFVGGPHGIGKLALQQPSYSVFVLGDPEDRSLRKIEADVLIPNLMNREIEKTECRPEYEDLVACLRREGGALGLKLCKDTLAVFNTCKLKMFNSGEFRQKITDGYLDERAYARRTGLTAKERKLEEYRQWRKENPNAERKID